MSNYIKVVYPEKKNHPSSTSVPVDNELASGFFTDDVDEIANQLILNDIYHINRAYRQYGDTLCYDSLICAKINKKLSELVN